VARQLGATFVGRSFSGDKAQLVPLIRAAIEHKGSAFIDVISPCVAFNNHAGSTRSYDYVREHNEAVNRIDFITKREEITTSYEPGAVQEVMQHDGSVLRLRKVNADYDPSNHVGVMSYLLQRAQEGEVVTGLLYLHPDSEDLHEHLNTVTAPLNSLSARELCPGSAALEKLNASLR